MREYLATELDAIEGCEWHDDGDNIYAGKGTGPRVCMVAHMDTVHPIVEDLTPIAINGKITGMNAVTMEQTGIGGDDKVGVYIALEMLRTHPNIKCFFPRDEEVGCIGSSYVETSYFDDVTMVLQCDRRGNTDFITNASGVELSSNAFQADVLPILSKYGYKFSTGMMTDVMELKERGINLCMANISCGYYNPHDDTEYVDIAHVEICAMMVNEIIHSMGSVTYIHVAPPKPSWKSASADWDDKWGKSDIEWWNDNRTFDDEERATSRIHDLDSYCQDCWQKPAVGAHGLCESCHEYYQSTIMSKPDYGPPVKTIPRGRTIAEIEETRRQLAKLTATPKKKRKKKGKTKPYHAYKHW